MSTGKLITIAVVALLAWQHQAAIGSQLEPIRNVVPRVRSYFEMRRYAAELGDFLEENGAPPEELAGWLDERFVAEGDRPASVDPFGNPYRVDRDRELGWVLRSAGPDGLYLTEDDLLETLRTGE